ncbi:hypothetical protein [Roseateles koreensis]|uniref:Uncharacterized protein n=1 Tax=Roseateles koreensis TaxID=2987526 RepID=A0ABT5KWD7_9BURK|nr:hypothetical protein [Roseateles koreensis]MDC8787269.1 hypothetical protein [Roseateles koreensis]
MSTTLILIPPEDACVIARLSRALAKRLVQSSDVPARRQTLMRALFGLQRLPILIPDLNISISAGQYQFQIDSEHCGFVSYTEDGHTEFRIQYFAGSSHCIEWFATLVGEVKIGAAMLRLDAFAEAMEEADQLTVADYSTPGAADEPPINDYLEYAQTYDKP